MEVHTSGFAHPEKREPDTATMNNFKQEPVEELDYVSLQEEVYLKSEYCVLNESSEVVPEESSMTGETVLIKEEPEPIEDNCLEEKDIKQEIIELGEYELNIPANVSNDEQEKLDDSSVVHLSAQKPKNSNPKLECEHCGQTFVYPYRLALHRIKKHGSTETPVNRPVRRMTLPRNFHCDQCDKSYHLQTNLDIHKAKLHGQGEAPPRKTEYVLHTCKHCKKQITGWTYLVYHLKFVHGESIDKTQFVKCLSCLKKFASAEEMAEHLCLRGVNREKERPFKCDLCGKAYSAKTQLEDHYSVHPEYHHVSCDECAKGFFNERVLNSHKRNIHKAKESYIECVTCNKQFKNQSTWKIHQQIHTELEYCCEQCGKKFKTRNSLASHISNMHNTNRIDPEIPCTVCGKVFKGKRVLKRHMRCHSNDRRFKCSFLQCEKAFFSSTDLKLHEQSHTKDYRFKCKFCEYGSIRQKVVLLHEQQKHNS